MRSVGFVALVMSLMILLSSCWVNQNNLWAVDKLPSISPTSREVTEANIAYGDEDLQKLDLYLPASEVRGIIVWFHPGGWCCGDKVDIDPIILSTIDSGYAVVSVNYRLVPTVTAEQQLADADRALRFVKASRRAWGAGAGKVIVAGGSAGGTLALLLAGAPGQFSGPDLGLLAGIDPQVDAVISLVGPSDLRSYIDGETGEWVSGLAEGFLGCSNRGSQWPTSPTTSTTSTLPVAPRPTVAPTKDRVWELSSISLVEPSTAASDVSSGSSGMPPCDPNRVLKFSPILWAVLAELFGGDLPPAYLAYGDRDSVVPPSSQGVVLHDWWSAGGSWLETYYDNPPTGGHNLSNEMNATAFSLWLGLFGFP